MRIIHLITSLEGGGTENFLYQIISRSPAGVHHQVIFLKRDGVIGDRLRQLGIPVTRAASLAWLWRLLKRENPDILHTCLFRGNQIGRVVGRAAGLKKIISSQRSIDGWAKAWHRQLDAWTIPLCDRIIVNSGAAKRYIENRVPPRRCPPLVRISNGIDASRFTAKDRLGCRQQYGLPEDAVLGGSFLRLHSEKGADLIPALADSALPKWPKLHLVIAGTGPLAASLQATARRSPHGGRIHYLGWQDDVPSLLSALDFVWLLSREESFPQTLIEASSMGLPWVAPQVGGIPELLDSGAVGRLFPVDSVDRAAQTWDDFLKDLNEHKTKAVAAAPMIRSQYSLERMAEEVYRVFGTC
jgi:glycosyltransferase involved in cell wall biosynthesis